MLFKKTSLAVAVLAGLGLSTNVFAQENFNARVKAMGGAGTAIADYDSSANFNPALVAGSSKNDDFAFNLSFGADVNDREDVYENVDDFLDGVEDLEDEYSLDKANELIGYAEEADRKSVFVEGGGTAFLAFPNKWVNVSLYYDVYGAGDAFLDYDETDSIQLMLPGFQEENLNSRGAVVGYDVEELGLTFAKELNIPYMGNTDVGFTTKSQRVKTYAYSEKVSDFEASDFDKDAYSTDDSNRNIDFGIRKNINKNWAFALTGKNLIKEEYQTVDLVLVDDLGGTETVEGASIQIEPRYVAGVGYQTDSGVLKFAVDGDLNSTEEIVYENNVLSERDFEKQFVRAGVEIGHKNVAQVRFGYRHDLKDNFEDVATIGLGISPFNVVNVDVVGQYGREQSYGVGLQLGARF